MQDVTFLRQFQYIYNSFGGNGPVAQNKCVKLRFDIDKETSENSLWNEMIIQICSKIPVSVTIIRTLHKGHRIVALTPKEKESISA